MNGITLEEGLLRELWLVLQALRDAKPEERSDVSRRYAVTINELEKVVAYFKTFVVDSHLREAKG